MYEKDFGSAGVQQRRVEVQHGCGCDQGSGIYHRHYRKSISQCGEVQTFPPAFGPNMKGMKN